MLIVVLGAYIYECYNVECCSSQGIEAAKKAPGSRGDVAASCTEMIKNPYNTKAPWSRNERCHLTDGSPLCRKHSQGDCLDSNPKIVKARKDKTLEDVDLVVLREKSSQTQNPK